jgi:tol-pal system protein YbgF
MGLTNYNRVLNEFKHSWIIFSVFIAFVLIGCGGSEKATTDQQVQQEPAIQPAPTAETTQPKEQVKEQPKEEAPMDQALTSFVGSDEPKAEPAKQPVVAVSSTPSQLGQYEKQIGDLRTENTSVKQRNVKLEEDNRLLTARLNDTEAKLAAEKDRADKAESGAKITVVAPNAEAAATTATPEVATPGSYNDALKAFQTHKYDEALKGFQSVVSSGASEDVAGNAKYWIGETHFAKKNYKVALEDFQGILKLKNSVKKGDAQFMLGQTYERLGSKAKAKAAYEKVVKEYPMNKNVKRAKQRWAKL